jgi:hypothetical protein
MMIPRGKRLLAAPDEIRRALLIAAPIALFGGNAALADTAFTKFSFPATGARANRTMPDRLSDIFNVKDYGAVGNWNGSSGADDTVAIQAALTAANGSGTVFFPHGTYQITSRLTVPDGYAGIAIIGSGPALNVATGNGTIITGNFNDWLLTTEQKNNSHQPLKLIQGITFSNSNATPPVSTDVTPGCIRISSGIGVIIRDCEIDIRSGIGIYMASQNHLITNTNILGHYPGNTCYGAWINSSWIENCKIQNLDTGIIYAGNGFAGGLRNIDLEVSGDGILVGHNPLPWYDTNQSWPPLQAVQSVSSSSGVFENLGVESCYRTPIRIAAADNCVFHAIKLLCSTPYNATDGIIIDPVYGGDAHNCRFSNIYILPVTTAIPGSRWDTGAVDAHLGTSKNSSFPRPVRI